MSKRNQDIPIRPRYGIVEATDDSERAEKPKPRRIVNSAGTMSGGGQCKEMASSYSEIPFLAQYAGAVPQSELNERTPTEDTAASNASPNNVEQNDNDEDFDGDSPLEDEEDNSSGAMAHNKQKRPNSLHYDSSFPYELERTTSNEGEMRHFVAENLEERLRTGSPLSRRDQMASVSHNSTPSASTGGSLLTRHFLQTQLPQIDANALSDIELEAQYLAASVDNLMENLCNLLHSISSITADNVELHRNAVNKLTDSMDANIKCMYTIMAKTEEITKSMKPTEQLGQRIREIKRLVDMLDTTM